MIQRSREERNMKQLDLGAAGTDIKAQTSLRSWSSSALKNPRIVRVSRSFGGKDRHSKVRTIRGLRDRRVRLSVPTAIQLYDLQDKLGLNQPSKVVDWLLSNAQHEIDKLPPLEMIQGEHHHHLFQFPPYNLASSDQAFFGNTSTANDNEYILRNHKAQAGILSDSAHNSLGFLKRSKEKEALEDLNIEKRNLMQDEGGEQVHHGFVLENNAISATYSTPFYNLESASSNDYLSQGQTPISILASYMAAAAASNVPHLMALHKDSN
ncbi:hypothetical protein Cni_G23243 [Canna indica]|uniref:TCP domain-containing protein n=1 Tax=Canna indica TaxID=4628 RepID=A0AAQ3KT19_9LILI|nr:hypothetical protein Cni_G23243 [Canna indica]